MATNGYVRRATKADRDGILSIIPAGEYDGDYLHDYFDMLMENPLYKAFVYVIQENIIGLAAIFIIDGGSTGALRSGRVRKDYQGKGIVIKIECEIYQQFPEIKYIVTASASRLKELYDFIKSGKANVRLMATRKCLFYTGSKEKMPNVSEFSGTKVMQISDLQKMFREQKEYPLVFVNDRMVIDSILYRKMESNAPIILHEKTRAIVSCQDNSDKTLLTFGSYFKQPTGDLFCKIDVYGVIGKSLRSHILLHLKMAMENTTCINDVFTVEIRPKENNEIIEQVMTDIGMKNASIGRRTDVVCTEFLSIIYSQL